MVHHEYSHKVVWDIQSGISSGVNGEEGAISEGVPDYFAGSFTGRSRILEYSVSLYHRDMNSPDISNYTQYQNLPSYPNVSSHDGGEFFSSILWDIRNNSGITSTQADFLVFDALFRITGNPDFLEFRDAMIAADNAYGGSHYALIRNAFAAKGVGTFAPPSTPTGVTASACSYCTPYVNWPDNPETDISHYEVWRQKDYSYNPYSMIGTTTNSYYYDNSLIGSSTWYGGGDNYRYAVVAVNTTNLKSYRSSPSGWINALERNKVHPGRASEEALPESFALRDNYPNPFNPSTVISFDLPEASVVTLKVFNIMGQEVATLVNQNMEAGRFTRNFDAANLSSGFYIARFEALGNSGKAYTKTINMQLIK